MKIVRNVHFHILNKRVIKKNIIREYYRLVLTIDITLRSNYDCVVIYTLFQKN